MKNDTEILFDYDTALEEVKNEIRNILLAAPLIVREYTGHLATSLGKSIRAASVIACAMDESEKVSSKAVKLAAGIEILHLATLVHDDVMDKADTRRGIETLNKKYGNKTAVICGDYLVCLALKIANSEAEKTDSERALKMKVPDYISRVCLGELNQHINNGNLELTVPKYFRIIAGKTAALFEASFFTGAAINIDDEKILKKYARLGHNIGMIFQLTDDCIDFEENKEIAGKNVQSDYEQNVITLPLIHALKNMKGLKSKAKEKKLTRQEINKAVSITGGLDITRLYAKTYYIKAEKIINELEISKCKKDKLMYLLNKAYRSN